MKDDFHLPRLLSAGDFSPGAAVSLPAAQAHYLKNVLRLGPGASVRLFNGREGEWLAEIAALDKKGATLALQRQLRPQPPAAAPLALLFSPIKKHRQDILIEKAVELGVSDFHPVLTERSVVRKLNAARAEAQILEAAEQCERFSIPRLHPLRKLEDVLRAWPKDKPLTAALEREEGAAPPLSALPPEARSAFLIGPEGGFGPAEKAMLRGFSFVQPVSLGETVFRVETAAIICLCAAQF